MEILIYLAYKQKIPNKLINKIIECTNIQDALEMLESIDSKVANQLWLTIANTIELRTLQYISKYTSHEIKVGVGLFNKSREIRWISKSGRLML